MSFVAIVTGAAMILACVAIAGALIAGVREV